MPCAGLDGNATRWSRLALWHCVVQTTAWRPDPGDDDFGGKSTMYCGVARKP